MEKKDLLIKLQKQEQIHVVLSKCTRLPYVYCDAETYDDEIFIFFDEKDANVKAEVLTKDGELVVVVPIPNKNFLPFYAGLFPMGVNAIVVDGDTEKEMCIQLEELVREHGRTIVIVTHTREVSRMADRIIELRNGKIFREELNDHIVSARDIAW